MRSLRSRLFVAMAVMGSMRAARSAGSREAAAAMAASLILRSALLLTLDNSEARYTLEFFPVLFVWAGGLFAAQSESVP